MHPMVQVLDPWCLGMQGAGTCWGPRLLREELMQFLGSWLLRWGGSNVQPRLVDTAPCLPALPDITECSAPKL